MAATQCEKLVTSGRRDRAPAPLPLATPRPNPESHCVRIYNRDMQFDRFTVALLMLRPDAPELDDAAATELQDAHMAHLADLHDAGYLVAAGPLLGPPD